MFLSAARARLAAPVPAFATRGGRSPLSRTPSLLSTLLNPSRALSALVDKPLIPTKINPHPYTTGNYRYLPGFSFPAPRTLDSIIKLPLLERETPARIREIWNEYHDARMDSVATTWSTDELAAVRERARRCPRFVVPVLKGEGKFFNLVSQWQDNFCIFTFLEDFRRDASRAEPYLSIAVYEDLVPRHALALVRGDFSGHLTKRDAAHVLNLMRFFYFSEPKWVEAFNRDPAAFDFTAYLAAVPPPPEKFAPSAGRVDRA